MGSSGRLTALVSYSTKCHWTYFSSSVPRVCGTPSIRLPVCPFPPAGPVAAPFGSPAVPRLRRYYGRVRLLADPSLPPPVSLGGRYSTSRVYSLPVGPPSFPLGTWFFSGWAEPHPARERSVALLGSREVLLKACPGLGTPATPEQPRTIGCLGAAFRCPNGVGVAMMYDVGAESSRPAFLLCTLRTRRSPDERQHSLLVCLLRL